MADICPPSSPFLRLPLEIRLMIYEELLLPSSKPCYSQGTSVANLLPDHSTYYSPDTNSSPFDLAVRSVDPYLGAYVSCGWRRRSRYHIRTGPFLTCTTSTTYRVLLSPYTAHLRHTVPSLLHLNRQIHTEAAKVLYSTYTFRFGANIEAAVPFLSDLTPIARSYVRHIQLMKKALPYTKDFDRYEWSHTCGYLATQLQLRSLDLHVVAGLQTPVAVAAALQQSPSGSSSSSSDSFKADDGIGTITKEGFETLRHVQKERKRGMHLGVDLEWAEELMQIKGLRKMSVKAVVEHCAVPKSEGMLFWVAFSGSVEEGFREWVCESMVGEV